MTGTMVAVISAVAGLLAGVVGSLVAPWVNWGIEKRREKFAARRELLSMARSVVRDSVFRFANSTSYRRLKPYLSNDLVAALENPEEVQDRMDNPQEFEAAMRADILDQLQALERKWDLV